MSKDEVGYLKSLGMARTSEVMRDARIGEAEALMESKVKLKFYQSIKYQTFCFNCILLTYPSATNKSNQYFIDGDRRSRVTKNGSKT